MGGILPLIAAGPDVAPHLSFATPPSWPTTSQLLVWDVPLAVGAAVTESPTDTDMVDVEVGHLVGGAMSMNRIWAVVGQHARQVDVHAASRSSRV